jgi:hypothetical protein
MSRRPDPDRIAVARQEAVRARLRSGGFQPAHIDRLLADWATLNSERAVDRLSRRYWDELDAWVKVEETLPPRKADS